MVRFGVVGARRVRIGIGEYVAREIARGGGEVVAVAGSSERTAAEAAAQLLARHGIRARPFASTAAMVLAGGLDALAICTPNEVHEEGIRAALGAGLHALCDKPLIFEAARDRSADCRTLAEAFAARGLRLETTTQWPETLGAFLALYPELGSLGGGAVRLARPPRTFAMRMAPPQEGVGGLVDCLSHPLSVLRALVGPGEARLAGHRAIAAGAVLGFEYVHAGGRILCELSARPKEAQPRPAAYAIDGRAAAREIVMPGYGMAMVGAGGRRVPLEDPLRTFVRGFIQRIERRTPYDPREVASDAAGLEALLRPLLPRAGG